MLTPAGLQNRHPPSPVEFNQQVDSPRESALQPHYNHQTQSCKCADPAAHEHPRALPPQQINGGKDSECELTDDPPSTAEKTIADSTARREEENEREMGEVQRGFQNSNRRTP